MYLFAAAQACPAFFFGPLVALLLLSRPRTLREWGWIGLSVALLAAWLQFPDSLAQQMNRASAACFVAAFAATCIGGVRPLFNRAIVALLLAAMAMVGWFVAFHHQFLSVEHEIVVETWQAWRSVGFDLPAVMPVVGDLASDVGSPDKAHQYAALLAGMASLYPSFLALIALSGARLAWSWYQRIARTPLLPPANPLRDFRFNDHAVWLLIATVATLLTGSSPGVSLAAANVLMVVAALYAVRGAAVFLSWPVRTSPFMLIILALMLLPLLITAVLPILLVLVGVADTWLDFRRRMAPPTGVPS